MAGSLRRSLPNLAGYLTGDYISSASSTPPVISDFIQALTVCFRSTFLLSSPCYRLTVHRHLLQPVRVRHLDALVLGWGW